MLFGVFGNINLPGQLASYGEYNVGLVKFLNNLYKMIVLGAGLFAIVNFILAGYGIMSSQGDPEKLSKAQSKIWNSIIGLIIIVAAFAIGKLVSWIMFKDAYDITSPIIYGP
ncbi:hypothetical protein ACFLZ1_00410 [Patescibacteria group bacterium]